MARHTATIALAAFTLAGAVLGSLGSSLMAAQSKSDVRYETATGTPTADGTGAHRPSDAELEMRVRRIERELVEKPESRRDHAVEPLLHEDSGEDWPAGDETHEPVPPEEFMANERALADERWESFGRAFDAEPVDPDWSEKVSEGIEIELLTLLDDNDGQLQLLECKSRICRSTMVWEDTTTLRAGAVPIVHHPFETVNCARHLRLFEEMNEAVLYVDCREQQI